MADATTGGLPAVKIDTLKPVEIYDELLIPGEFQGQAVHITGKKLRGYVGAGGKGIPTGGTIGQVLTKKSDNDFDADWVDPPSGSGGEIGGAGDGSFVAFSTNSNKAAYSTDSGKTWSDSTLPFSSYWSDIAYGNGVFIALTGESSTNKAIYSKDGGKTWSETTLPFSAYWKSIAYGNGVFIAATDRGGKAIYSADGGMTWTETTLDTRSSSIAYGGGTFVIVTGNSNQAVYSTDDGKTWDKAELPSYVYWNGLAYGGGAFVAIAGANSNKAAYSTDGGKTWSDSTLPSSAYWCDIAYGDGIFVAVGGSDSNSVAYSTNNGRTWAEAIVGDAYSSIAYGNGVFVAVKSSTNKAIYSKDGGKTWLETALPSYATGYATGYARIAYGEQSSESGDTTSDIVTSFNGRTGEVVPEASDYTPELIGAVPITRKIDGKVLSSDVSVLPAGGSAGQILAKKTTENYDTQWIDAPQGGVTSFNTRTGAVTPQSGDYTAAMVGARADTWTPTAQEVGAIPSGVVNEIVLTTESGYESSIKAPTTLYLIPEE